MNFSEKIIKENKKEADNRVAFVTRLMVIFMAVIAILNILNIFKIEGTPLYLTVAISMINFLIPTILYNFLHINNEKI